MVDGCACSHIVRQPRSNFASAVYMSSGALPLLQRGQRIVIRVGSIQIQKVKFVLCSANETSDVAFRRGTLAGSLSPAQDGRGQGESFGRLLFEEMKTQLKKATVLCSGLCIPCTGPCSAAKLYGLVERCRGL